MVRFWLPWTCVCRVECSKKARAAGPPPAARRCQHKAEQGAAETDFKKTGFEIAASIRLAHNSRPCLLLVMESQLQIRSAPVATGRLIGRATYRSAGKTAVGRRPRVFPPRRRFRIGPSPPCFLNRRPGYLSSLGRSRMTLCRTFNPDAVEGLQKLPDTPVWIVSGLFCWADCDSVGGSCSLARTALVSGWWPSYNAFERVRVLAPHDEWIHSSGPQCSKTKQEHELERLK